MPLNSAQAQAVEYLSGPLLVLAGPGTGKTQLLSAKVAYILEHTDANPENILCITFTESGARNMRDRLLSMIGPAAHQVNIHTYHAFGTTILQSYHHYSSTPTAPLDHPIDTVTQFKIIDSLKSQLSAFDLLRATPTKDILDTITSAKSARLTPTDLEKIITRNLEDSSAISTELDPILKAIIPRMKLSSALPIYQSILEILLRFTSNTPISSHIEPLANSLALDLKSKLDDITNSEKPSLSPLTKWKNRHFELDHRGNYRLSYDIANRKLASLAKIYQNYDRSLKTNGLFDFADMIESAIKILKSDNGFRLTLSEKFQYLLLDEFQDTNPSQFELIKLLTDYEQPSIMAVGDDDQAIYAFQGASASNLLDFQSHYHAKIITLTENYRSTAEILDFSRHIATQISDRFSSAHNINKILMSVRSLNAKNPDSTTKISRHEFISSADEYHWIAAEVDHLIQAGVSPNNISIIAPKHKYIAPLLPFFKPYPHIKISYEKRDNLLLDPALLPLFSLTDFILALSSGAAPKHQLLELLSYDFWGIDPVIIINTLESRQLLTLEILQTSPDPNLKNLVRFFAHLAKLAKTTPLETILSYFIGAKPLDNFTSPYLDFYTNPKNYENKAAAPDSLRFELFEKLLSLTEAVKNHTGHPDPTLADLSVFLSDYRLADQPLTNSSPYQAFTNSIEIQSAHKSKGLEYDYVFLIAANDHAWGKGKGNNNLLALPPNLAPIRHTGMTEDEQLRLFFVAITRAKTHLIITNSQADFSGKNLARLSYLSESNQQDIIASPFIPAGVVDSHTPDSTDPTTLPDLYLTWLKNYQPTLPDIKTTLRSRHQNYTLTASDLLTFIDIIHSGPQVFYKERLLPHLHEPATIAQTYGTLLHSTFEKIVNHHFSAPDAIDFYLSELAKLQLSDDDQRFLAEKGPAAIKLSIDNFREILHNKNARAEVNLRSEKILLDNSPITGVIDLLIADPETKTLHIYDFKTGKAHTDKWLSTKLYRYAYQLTFYKLLLENSPTYKDYTVASAHILFVTPDSDQLVHDRIYDFDPETTDLIKRLIYTLPPLITSLDFTSDPEIYLPPDKTRNFSDLQQFIKLMLAKYSDQ